LEGRSEPNSELIEGDKDTIFILEGIHALNPKLIEKVGTKDVYKIFINNGQGYELEGTKVEPRQFRMVRRMVRDVQFRGVSMANTIKHWKDVTDAEDLYIIPHSRNVDSTINTSHAYEPCLYKQDIERAIANGEINLETHPWFKIFAAVDELDKKYLPETTLMKEFVSFE
jgi:uridine kinase